MAQNGTVEIKGIEERIKQFGEASTKNPEMRRRINEVIRQTLAAVRKSLQNQAHSGLQMKSDPRNAYKAIRMAVYRRIFGGQVNILQNRRAGNLRLYEPQRKGTSDPYGRGGNRATRSGRTTTMMSYQGADRGFILRFLNQGTDDRAIHSMGNRNLSRGGISILKMFHRRRNHLHLFAVPIRASADCGVVGLGGTGRKDHFIRFAIEKRRHFLTRLFNFLSAFL